jgi:hypothetical protein
MISRLLVDQSRYPLTAAAGAAYHEQFARDKYVRFPGFFTLDAFALLADEVERLRQLAIRRDLQMQGSDGSPRRMSTLGGHVIGEYSTLVPQLYSDSHLLTFLSGVAGEEVLEVPDPVENFVLNVLHRPGDIHGGHIDVYAFAFNIFIEGPPEDAGGALEFVPSSDQLADLKGPKVRRVWHQPNDCYLLKTDEAPHRVSPLTRETRRTIINMAFANHATADLASYSSSVLYGGRPLQTAEEPAAYDREEDPDMSAAVTNLA